jgi:hypothetical protein
MAATHFDQTRFPDPVAYFERIFGRLRFNGAGWAQVNCCFHTPDREPSLSLHRGGGFNCFACLAHGGDILEFEHLHTGRGRRAIAQGWGAWSGKPIFEPPRSAWVRPAPRPVIVRDRAEKPQLTAKYFAAASLNFEAVRAAAHALCDRGFSVHPVDGKAPRSPGWPDAPRKTHEDIEREFRPRFLDGFIAYPNLGFRIDMEPAGDAPNCVTDVDIRTDDPAAVEQCMAATRRHMGDRQPDAITGVAAFISMTSCRAPGSSAYLGLLRLGARGPVSSSLIGPAQPRALLRPAMERAGPSRCSPRATTFWLRPASIP